MGLFDKITYEGIGNDVRATFKHSTLTKGTDELKPVKISSDDTVALSSDNDDFHGVVESIEKKFCTVLLTGFVSLTYSGTAPTVGYQGLRSAGSGKVEVNANSHKRLVVNIDTTDKKIKVFLG